MLVITKFYIGYIEYIYVYSRVTKVTNLHVHLYRNRQYIIYKVYTRYIYLLI